MLRNIATCYGALSVALLIACTSILQMTEVSKYSVGGNKTGGHQNISDSHGRLKAVVSDEVHHEDLDAEDILHDMDTPFVYDTASGTDSNVNIPGSI